MLNYAVRRVVAVQDDTAHANYEALLGMVGAGGKPVDKMKEVSEFLKGEAR